MNKYTMSILALFLSSCTILNRDSQEHYQLKKKLRHGILPLAMKQVKGNKPTRKIDLKAAERGKILFKNNCVSCHGHNGEGNGPLSSKQKTSPKNLVNIAKNVPNFKFYMMVSQWEGGMPGWRSMLSDKDIADIEQYILKLSNK